jgi:hypothetical protein
MRYVRNNPFCITTTFRHQSFNHSRLRNNLALNRRCIPAVVRKHSPLLRDARLRSDDAACAKSDRLAIRSAHFDLTVPHSHLQDRLCVNRWTLEHPPIFE